MYDAGGTLHQVVKFEANLNQMIVTEAGQAFFRQAIVDAGG